MFYTQYCEFLRARTNIQLHEFHSQIVPAVYTGGVGGSQLTNNIFGDIFACGQRFHVNALLRRTVRDLWLISGEMMTVPTENDISFSRFFLSAILFEIENMRKAPQLDGADYLFLHKTNSVHWKRVSHLNGYLISEASNVCSSAVHIYRRDRAHSGIVSELRIL